MLGFFLLLRFFAAIVLQKSFVKNRKQYLFIALSHLDLHAFITMNIYHNNRFKIRLIKTE